MSSLCVVSPTEAFWHCFASSKMVSWQQFLHSRVFSSHGYWHFFFATLVQLCSVIWSNPAFCHSSWWRWWNFPVIQNYIVLCKFKWWYNVTFCKMFYSCSVLKKKKAFKSTFQKISGYSKVKARFGFFVLWHINSF